MPTDGSVTSTQKPSRQVRRAQARRRPAQAEPRLSPAQAAQGLTEEIMATAAAKAGARALTQAELTNAEIQTWQFPADYALGLAQNAAASRTSRKSRPCWSPKCPRSRPLRWPSAWA